VEDLIGAAPGAGAVPAAAVVSEPVSDYIRWEHSISEGNVDAGEDVRWLPRSAMFDLMVPGADSSCSTSA